MKTIIGIVIVVGIILIGWYFLKPDTTQESLQTNNSTQKNEEQQVVASEKPVITNNSGSSIKGKTKPNYVVWAYGAGESCLTRNTMATYGAGKADANGNFSINIPNAAAAGKLNVVVAAFPEKSTYILQGVGGIDSCFPQTNLSSVTTFTYSAN